MIGRGESRLPRNQIQQQIRARAQSTANVLFTRHALGRMRERQITIAMVYEVLRKGVLRREPERDLRHDALECRMELRVEGRDIGAVVAFAMDRDRLPVVTVMNI